VYQEHCDYFVTDDQGQFKALPVGQASVVIKSIAAD